MAIAWALTALAGGAVADEKPPQSASKSAERPIRVLFVGDRGHHVPLERFAQLEPVLARRGINLVYTDRLEDLEPTRLASFRAVALYANHDRIEPAQAKALLDYVAAGGGFAPLHCASYCFRNNDEVVALIGAQFQRHGTGVFRTKVTEPNHPVMAGFTGFESWDETYVHTKHNPKDRVVLEVRDENGSDEPWTWVRTHGKGRVFYTAWGHDERTWAQPGFQNLVERGLRWVAAMDPAAAGPYVDRPEMNPKRADLKPFEFAPAKLPFYPAGERWGTTAEPINRMQMAVPAEESLKHYITPKGFELKLFAAEPEIVKPIAFNWDERGRLWLAETVDYPNDMQPQGRGNDRIRIAEDTDGDGKADRFTVFADRLSIPTSLIPAFGGVIVHQAPHTLFLKDTDGDGKADLRKILMTGWETNDTHAGPSNLNYGPDGWYHSMVGYSGFRGTVADEEHSFRTGFLRFKVEDRPGTGVTVTKLEFLRNTNNNSWGVGFSEEGLLFGSTANGCPSVFLPIPNRYYERVRGWSSTVLASIAESNKFEPVMEGVRQVDHHGGFTAGAGHALYTARNYPPEYWNRTSFVTEPTGHLIATFRLFPTGAGFRAKNSWNLAASDDDWAAPIAAEVGPDGNVWFLDWYNLIVQHNPTPAGYETGKGNAYVIPYRDRTHGRVYRMIHARTPDRGVSTRDLSKATPAELVAALADPNFFWRRQAQRLLTERGQKDVVPALVELIRTAPIDAIGLAPGAIHSLQTLKALAAVPADGPGRSGVVSALRHPSAGARRAAVLALSGEPGGLEAIIGAGLLRDPEPQVQLATLLAIADARSDDPAAGSAMEGVLALLTGDSAAPRDPILVDGMIAAAGSHADRFLTRAIGVSGERPASDALVGVLARIGEHVARSRPDAARLGPMVTALASASSPVAEAILGGMSKGWPRSHKVSLGASADPAIEALLKKLPLEGRRLLVGLAPNWGTAAAERFVATIVADLGAAVKDGKRSDGDRAAAARQLVEFRADDADVVKELVALIGPRTSPELAVGLVTAAGLSRAERGGNELAARLEALTPAVRQAAYRALLGRREWTPALLASLEKSQGSIGELSLDQKQALSAHPDRAIAERAKKLIAAGGGLPSADRQKVIDEWDSVTKATGDHTLGKAVFKTNCAKCHKHSGEGENIGPDLTGMAVHPKHELLIHILDPNRSVEGNFRIWQVATEDGRVLNGLLSSETRTAIELIDSEAKKHVIQRDEIETLKASTKSLMPEGFEKQIKKPEMENLLAFLTKRGRFTPLPLTKAATINTTRGMFYTDDSDGERIIFPDYGPKLVAGVPFALIDPVGRRNPNAIMLFGPEGKTPPRMPRTVSVPVNQTCKSLHFLSGISGWGYPLGRKDSVSMTVRIVYEDGTREDVPLRNGRHFADYIRKVEVPESTHAFDLEGKQLRMLSVMPRRTDKVIRELELVKGPDRTAPIVFAITAEAP
jgi:hypothetical protein